MSFRFKSLLVRFYVSLTQTFKYNVIHCGKNDLLLTHNHSTIIFFARKEAVLSETKYIRDFLFYLQLLSHEYIMMPCSPVTLTGKVMGVFLLGFSPSLRDGKEVSISFSHFNMMCGDANLDLWQPFCNHE